MYNFLGLTNDVATRLNEVPLTSTNFASASGFHADIKSYINEAITRINLENYEWPFNHVYKDSVLTPNTVLYDWVDPTRFLVYDSFVIKKSDTLNVESRRLKVLDYEEHLDKTLDMELSPADYAGVPQWIFKGRGLSYGIIPAPDKAYEIRYEYYQLTSDMVGWDEVPAIPEGYRWVIIQGALYNAYMFRGDTEQAAAADTLFRKGISDMRKIYSNRYEYVRSTMIEG